jgi:hypothetical protein
MEFCVLCQKSDCRNMLKAEIKFGVQYQKKILDQAGWKQIEGVGMICPTCLKGMFKKVSLN